MLNFMLKHKLEEVKEGDPGGGVTPPAPPAPAFPAIPKPSDLGYDDPPAPPEAKPDDKKPDPKPDEKPPEPAVSGYDKPPKVEEEPPAPPAEPPPADDLDKALEGLEKEEAGKIKEFASKNKLSPEQVKAYGELRKSEIAAEAEAAKNAEKEMEREVQRTRAAWHDELKNDPTFGGESFSKSVHSVERILGDLMPQTKKRLTETKGMLPPYLMRDLAGIAKRLYGTDNLVQGEPVAAKPKNDDKKNDPLAFYE